MIRFFSALLGCILFLSNCGPSNNESGKKEEVKLLPDIEKIITETKYDLYVLMKGGDQADIEEALIERGKTYFMDWKVKVTKHNEWTVIKFLKADAEAFERHTLSQYFFKPLNDWPTLEEGDLGISLSIDPEGKNTYLAYYNKAIMDASVDCEVYGVFEDNRKAELSACGNFAIDPEGKNIRDFDDILSEVGLDLEGIQKLKFPGKSIKVNTKKD